MFLLLIIDRASKILSLQLPTEGFFCANKIIGLKLLLNRGVAFGIPIPTILSITISTTILLVLIYIITKNGYIQSLNAKIGVGLVILGANSNLLDKINHQAIIDFITISFFPIFNLADLYIVAGLLLFITYFKKKIKRPISTKIQ